MAVSSYERDITTNFWLSQADSYPTVSGSVWAFDADAPLTPLWHKQLISIPEEIPFQEEINNEPNRTYALVSTPVINPSTGTLYAVCASQTKTEPVKYFHRLHALNIATGEELSVSPVKIEGGVSGQSFINEKQLNRPGLLLHYGVIYIAFGSYGDDPLAHGWVFAYDSITLRKVGVFCSSPDSSTDPPLAEIWQSGMGLSADSDGYVYFATGNGDFNADTGGGRNYGNSVVKLRRDLTVADYFTPCNFADLNAHDVDLGSGGVMVVPYQHGLHPKLLLACGKEGTIYVIDRTNMGKGKSAQPNPGPNGICDDSMPPLVDRQVRAIGGAPTTSVNRDALFGGPTYFEDPSGTQRCYYCGSYPLDPAPPTPQPDHLKAFKLDSTTGKLTPPQLSEESLDLFGGEGGSIPVVSSNGSSDGIVWQMDRSVENRDVPAFDLVAFDATNLPSSLVRLPTTFPPYSPFQVPTVMNGKVYVASNKTLFVFGVG